MHIPDNYLSPETCIVMGAVMVPVLAYSVNKVRKEFPENRIPLIGVGAALSFLVMMFNVPVPGGTTAHAVGGALLAIILGPEAACLAMSAALLIQALFFGDGGILALGANLFNMAFVMPFAGYVVYRFLSHRFASEKGRMMSAAAAAYVSFNLASLFAGVEFGIQPLLFIDAAGRPLYAPYPPQIAVPAMMIPALTIAGLAEVIFTTGVLTFLKKVSPDILLRHQMIRYKKVSALLLFLALLTPLGLFAAADAWGEWGSGDLRHTLGYLPRGMVGGFNFHAFFADYSLKGMPDGLGYIFSALAGSAVLVILFRLLKAGRKKEAHR